MENFLKVLCNVSQSYSLAIKVLACLAEAFTNMIIITYVNRCVIQLCYLPVAVGDVQVVG